MPHSSRVQFPAVGVFVDGDLQLQARDMALFVSQSAPKFWLLHHFPTPVGLSRRSNMWSARDASFYRDELASPYYGEAYDRDPFAYDDEEEPIRLCRAAVPARRGAAAFHRNDKTDDRSPRGKGSSASTPTITSASLKPSFVRCRGDAPERPHKWSLKSWITGKNKAFHDTQSRCKVDTSVGNGLQIGAANYGKSHFNVRIKWSPEDSSECTVRFIVGFCPAPGARFVAAHAQRQVRVPRRAAGRAPAALIISSLTPVMQKDDPVQVHAKLHSEASLDAGLSHSGCALRGKAKSSAGAEYHRTASAVARGHGTSSATARWAFQENRLPPSLGLQPEYELAVALQQPFATSHLLQIALSGSATLDLCKMFSSKQTLDIGTDERRYVRNIDLRS